MTPNNFPQIEGVAGASSSLSDNHEAQLNIPGLLLSKWYWILLLMIVGCGWGFVSTVRQPPMYAASATIELMGMNESFMGMNQVDPQAGAGNYGANAANMQTQLRILRSNTLLTRVAERVSAESAPMFPSSQGVFMDLRRRFKVVSDDPAQTLRDAIQRAAASTNAQAIGASRLILLSCESTSPDVAASFVNALASEYMAQNQQVRATSSSRTTQWLEGQLEETKTRLEQAETKLQDFVRNTGLDVAGEQTTLADSRMQQLQGDLALVQSERITKQTRYELAKSSPIEAVADIADDGGMKALREKLMESRRERAQLLATYTSEHPKVKKNAAQVAELEGMLKIEKDNLLRRLQNDSEAAVSRERLLTAAYRTQSRAVIGQSEKTADYATLKREVETTRQVYNLLLQQMNQSSIVSGIPTNVVRVIDAALPHSVPFKPSPPRDIATGTIGGAVLALALLVGREFLKLRKMRLVFASPGHSGDLLNVPELGVIPTLESAQTGSGMLRPFRSQKKLPAATPESMELVAWKHKPSLWAESFRFVISSVLDRGERGTSNAVIVVTSPGPGEGKTTLVSNLAIATAETGRRVLVIDADLRKSNLHKVFDVSDQLGLKDILLGGTSVEALDLESYTRPTEIPGVYVLTGGIAKAASPGELLFSRKLPSLLAKLRTRFDVVFIDTPPAVHFSDARRFARFADGVVIVIRAGVTPREHAFAVRHQFSSVGIPILGTVLNDCATEDYVGNYGRYYDYAQGASS